MISSRIEKLSSQIRQQFLVPLYANAYTLIFNQVTSAGLGMVYWTLVARLFSPEVVGQNTALISLIMLISAIAEFSLKSAMTRFVPRAGKQATRLILYTYSVNIVLSLIVTFVFFVLGNYFGFTTTLLSDTRYMPLVLVFFPIIWTLFYVQDGVLIGLRQPKWVLAENTIYNVAKIILLLSVFYINHRYLIIASWFFPIPFMIILVNWLVFFRFIPKKIGDKTDQPATITGRQIAKSVGGDHVGTVLAECCVRLLPLLVLNLLGKDANAYFFQAWLIGNTIYLIAYNLTSSFSVEASLNLQQIAVFSRHVLIQKARFIAPLAIGVLLFAPLILRLFGEEYSEQGRTLLRWMALAAFPLTLNIWYLGYARVIGEIGGVIRNQAIVAIVTLGLSYIWLPRFGITSIGISWFIAQTIVAIIVIIETAHVLLGNTVRYSKTLPVSLNILMRRADWRFLSSTLAPMRSLVFGESLLSDSVSSITIGETVTEKSVSNNSVELAVAFDPDQSKLKLIHSCLTTDGVIYSEWSAWRMGGVRGIEYRLKEAGFSKVKFFWAYPSVANPHFWFPVESDLSLYIYFTNQLFSRNDYFSKFLRKLICRGLYSLVSNGFVPCLSAISYKNPANNMALPDVIRKTWNSESNGPWSDQFSYLMQTDGSHLSSKIKFYLFLPGNPSPRWVVKLPRNLKDSQALRQEEIILSSIAQCDLEKFNDILVPQIYLSHSWNGYWISVQNALNGVPLKNFINYQTRNQIAYQLADWQISLAKLSKESVTHSFVIKQNINIYCDMLDSIARGRLSSTELVHIRKILSGIGLIPEVFAQNNFTPSNIMIVEGKLSVCDWTDAELYGFPMVDLVYGLTNVAFVSEGAWDVQHKVQVYKSLLDPKTNFGSIFQICLKRYSDALNMSYTQLVSMRLMTWVLHCYFEIQMHAVEMESEIFSSQEEDLYISLLKIELQNY